MIIRCSSLPLAFRCPGSIRTDDGVLVDPYFDAAEDGTEIHRLLACWPNGDAPADQLAALEKDARIVYLTGAKMWREEVSAWMPDSVPEEAFEDDEGTGHADRFYLRDGSTAAAVADWKCGRKDSDYKHQGFGYARRVFLRFPMVMTVTVHFLWVRAKEIESYTITRERSDAWEKERQEKVVNWDGTFHPGEHCTHCKRQATCPAVRHLARRDVEALTGQTLDLATMTGPELCAFRERCALVEKLLKSAKDALRAEVQARGRVDDGQGGVLYLKECNGSREVDTFKAWPVLQSRMTDEELASVLDVRLGDAEEVIAKKAGKGKGAQAKRDLAAELEAARAVTHSTQFKLTHERKA